MSDCDMCGGLGNTYTRSGKGMCLLCEVVLLEAEVARLREALERIAHPVASEFRLVDLVEIARAALAEKGGGA